MPFVETYSVDFRNGNVHPAPEPEWLVGHAAFPADP
jgi:hypothetical protein